MRRMFACVLLLVAAASALDRQPNEAYRARRQALAARTKDGIVVLFGGTERSTGDAIWGFHQDENFYYLTGLPDPGLALVIAPQQEAQGQRAAHSYTEILFVPARNRIQERWTGPKLGPDDPDVKQKTGFDRIEPLAHMPEEVAKLLPARVYSEQPVAGESSAVRNLTDWIQRANLGPAARFDDLRPLIASVRVVKDNGEIDLLRKAADASVAAHLAAMRATKPGTTERQIAALMQYEFDRRGCERPAYAPIVGAGFNSTVLHYSAGAAQIGDGDLVVIDVGGEYSGYATDITRTLPASGRFSARQREIYNIVLGAQQAAIAAFQSGKSALRGENSLHQVALDFINSHGKDLHGQPLGQYFIHGLSHYVGLDVHDPGDGTQPLRPGMVFTIEPGIYIPEEKLGVRIEDTFWVDPNGKLVNLSADLPHIADDVERTMAQPPTPAAQEFLTMSPK